MVVEQTSIKVIVDSILKCLECPICLDLLDDPVATGCNHRFCRNCIFTALKKKYAVACPLCKSKVTKRQLQQKIQLSEIVKVAKRLAETLEQDLLEKTISQVCSLSSSTSSDDQNKDIEIATPTTKKRRGQQSTEMPSKKVSRIEENEKSNQKTPTKQILVHPDAELQRKAKISTHLNIQRGFPARQRKGKRNTSNVIDKYLVRKNDGIEETTNNKENEGLPLHCSNKSVDENKLSEKNVKNSKHFWQRDGNDKIQQKSSTVSEENIPNHTIPETHAKKADESMSIKTAFESGTNVDEKNKKRNDRATSKEINGITKTGKENSAAKVNAGDNSVASSNEIIEIIETEKESLTTKKRCTRRNTRASSKEIIGTIEDDKITPSIRKDTKIENSTTNYNFSGLSVNIAIDTNASKQKNMETPEYSKKEAEQPMSLTLDPYEFIPSQASPKVVQKKKQSKRNKTIKRNLPLKLNTTDTKPRLSSVVPGVESFANSSEDFVSTKIKELDTSKITKKYAERATEKHLSDDGQQSDDLLFVTPALNVLELKAKTAFAPKNSNSDNKTLPQNNNNPNYITKCRRSKRTGSAQKVDLSTQEEISNWFDEIDSAENHTLHINDIKHKDLIDVPQPGETHKDDNNGESSEDSDGEVNRHDEMQIAEDCFDNSILSDSSDDTVFNDNNGSVENNTRENQNNVEMTINSHCQSADDLQNQHKRTHKQSIVLDPSLPKSGGTQSEPHLPVKNGNLVNNCDELCKKAENNTHTSNGKIENSIQSTNENTSSCTMHINDKISVHCNDTPVSDEKSWKSTQSTNETAATYTVQCSNKLETHIHNDIPASNEKSGYRIHSASEYAPRYTEKTEDDWKAQSDMSASNKETENTTQSTCECAATYTVQAGEELLNRTAIRKSETMSELDKSENGNRECLSHIADQMILDNDMPVTKSAENGTNSCDLSQDNDIESSDSMDHCKDGYSGDSMRQTFTIESNNKSVKKSAESNSQGKDPHCIENTSVQKSQRMSINEAEPELSLHSRCLFSDCNNDEESIPVSAVPDTPQSQKRGNLENNIPQANIVYQLGKEHGQHLGNRKPEPSEKLVNASDINGTCQSTLGEVHNDDAKFKMPKRKTFSLEVESQELKEYVLSNQHNTIDLLNEICMEFQNSHGKEHTEESSEKQSLNDNDSSDLPNTKKSPSSSEQCEKSWSKSPKSQIEKSQDVLKFSGKDSYEIPCGQKEHESKKITNQISAEEGDLCACSEICYQKLQTADLKGKENCFQVELVKSLGNDNEMHFNQFVQNDTPPSSITEYTLNSPERNLGVKNVSMNGDTLIIPLHDSDENFKKEKIILETPCPSCNWQIQLERKDDSLVLRFIRGKKNDKNKTHDEVCVIESAKGRQLDERETNEEMEKSSGCSESHPNVEMENHDNNGIIISSTYDVKKSNSSNCVVDGDCMYKESASNPKDGFGYESEDLLAGLTEMVPGTVLTGSYQEALCEGEKAESKGAIVIEDEIGAETNEGAEMDEDANSLSSTAKKESEESNNSEQFNQQNSSTKFEDSDDNRSHTNVLQNMKNCDEENYEMSEEIDPFLLRHNIPLNNSIEKWNIEKVLKETSVSSNDPDMMFAESLVAPLKSYKNKENQAKNKSLTADVNCDISSGKHNDNSKDSAALENLVSCLPTSPEHDVVRRQPLHPLKALNSQKQINNIKEKKSSSGNKRNSTAFRSPLSAKQQKRQFNRIRTMEDSDSDESTDEILKDSFNIPKQQRLQRKTKSLQKLHLHDDSSNVENDNRRDTRKFAGANWNPPRAKRCEIKASEQKAPSTQMSHVIDLSEVESNEELNHSEAQEKIRLEIEQMKAHIRQMEIQLQKTEKFNSSFQRREKGCTYTAEPSGSDEDSDDLFSPIPPTPPNSARKEESHRSMSHLR